MSLIQKIEQDLTQAFKAGETDKVAVLRLIKTSVTNFEKQANNASQITDGDVIGIVNKEIKQRQDTIDQLSQTRPEMVEKDKQAIEILKNYLPQQMNEDELKTIIDQAVSQTGATKPQDMGKVMGVVMPQIKGKADGSLVSKLVKEKLGA